MLVDCADVLRPSNLGPTKLGIFYKDLQTVQELSPQDAGITLPLREALLGLFQQAMDAGYRNLEFRLAALIDKGTSSVARQLRISSRGSVSLNPTPLRKSTSGYNGALRTEPQR